MRGVMGLSEIRVGTHSLCYVSAEPQEPVDRAGTTQTSLIGNVQRLLRVPVSTLGPAAALQRSYPMPNRLPDRGRPGHRYASAQTVR